MISLDHLVLRYGNGPDVLRIDGVEVLPDNALVALIGPNGGGKTTLLRAAAGLLRPASGMVRLQGTPLYGPRSMNRHHRARLVAVVLTDPVSPAYLRVQELVALGRIPHGGIPGGAAGADHRAVVQRSLEYTEVTHLQHRLIGSLSDGERQRVMVARALAQEPRILLLDEPTSHLDPPHQTALFELLRCLVESQVIETAVVATHQLHLALHFADHLVMVHREVHRGTPAELVASGALERAFQPHEHLEFDGQRGWFVPVAPDRHSPHPPELTE